MVNPYHYYLKVRFGLFKNWLCASYWIWIIMTSQWCSNYWTRLALLNLADFVVLQLADFLFFVQVTRACWSEPATCRNIYYIYTIGIVSCTQQLIWSNIMCTSLSSNNTHIITIYQTCVISSLCLDAVLPSLLRPFSLISLFISFFDRGMFAQSGMMIVMSPRAV